jgi:ketosteroid isomerase-like protein
MSSASDVVAQAYALAKKSDHRRLRELIADDATWQPSAKAKWKACGDADEIVRTLLWRASRANRLRPGETIELGSSVAFRLRGKRLERLGARGFWVPKLFQVVEVKGGKIVRMRDYGTMEEALTGTGHDS